MENLNISHINSSLIDFYLEPSNKWHLFEDGFEFNPKLNFTWKVDSFEQDLLTINLTFRDPEQISPKVEQDSVIFHIKTKEFLLSKTLNVLSDDFLTLSIHVKKQMENSAFNLNVDSAYQS